MDTEVQLVHWFVMFQELGLLDDFEIDPEKLKGFFLHMHNGCAPPTSASRALPWPDLPLFPAPRSPRRPCPLVPRAGTRARTQLHSSAWPSWRPSSSA